MKAHILVIKVNSTGHTFNGKVFSSKNKAISYIESKGGEYDLTEKQAYTDKYTYTIESFLIQ